MTTTPDTRESPSRVIARGQLVEFERLSKDRTASDAGAFCEALMELGSQVFHWIIKADHDYRRKLYEQPSLHDPLAEQELESLMRGWLVTGQSIVEWADHDAARRLNSSHLEEFRRCVEEAAAIIDSFDDVYRGGTMTEPLILLRDQALLDHQNGETSEFV